MKDELYLQWFTLSWCAVCVCGFDATAVAPRIDDWFKVLTIANFIALAIYSRVEDYKNGN